MHKTVSHLFFYCVAALVLNLGVSTNAYSEKNYRIDINTAYGTAHEVVVEGRMLKDRQNRPLSTEDGKWRNLKRNSRLFFNREGKAQPITLTLGAASAETQTDDEGYFQQYMTPQVPTNAGWQKVHVQSGLTQGSDDVLIVPAQNTHGIISDLDDTIIVSDVLNKRRLLANTLLKNPMQREAVPGMATLYHELLKRNAEPASAPMIYLSASPRQLGSAIKAFLTYHHFPRGVVITKRVSRDAASDPLLDQIAYKRRKIEEIFALLPQVNFTLVGDDGEKDPETYEQIRQKYPQRVNAIWIRRINPDPQRPRFAGQGEISEVLGAHAVEK